MLDGSSRHQCIVGGQRVHFDSGVIHSFFTFSFLFPFIFLSSYSHLYIKWALIAM